MMQETLDELRKIEQADARHYKSYRRKMRPILRGAADGRGWVTTDLHHLAENAGLGWQEAGFALRDMERRGEIFIAEFPDYYGQGLIQIRRRPDAMKIAVPAKKSRNFPQA